MKTIKKYLWLWEMIGAALVVTVGIIAKFVDGALLAIVGSTFIALGLLRVIPLVRTTHDKVLKWIYAIEIVANVVVGAILIYLAVQKKELKELFGYLIGGVLYARGLIYFYATTLRHEESDRPKFIAHVIFITLGTFIIARGGFSPEYLGWIIFAISIISAIFIGYSGYGRYRNYRNELAAKDITKKVKKEKVEIEAPTSDEIKVPNPEVNQENHDQLNA